MSAEIALDPPTVTDSGPDSPSLLGPGSRFAGLVSFRGQARVDGRLDGEVQARGRLDVGPDARVTARIEVDELVIAGAVEGELVARARVELLPTARVVGTLQTPILVVADGASFNGPLRTGPDASGSD